MMVYAGALTVDPASDFTAEISYLTISDHELEFVLEAREIRAEEPNWQIDCAIPLDKAVYRGNVWIQYESDHDERSNAEITIRAIRMADALEVEFMLCQRDSDNDIEDKWLLRGVLHPRLSI